MRLVLAAAVVAAAACGGSTGSGQAPSPSPDQTHAWLAYAACLRAHGANEPDPTFDQNGSPQWSVSPKTMPPAATEACATILESLHVQQRSAAPTAARLAQETRYAQCLRAHGIADFPDPDPRTGQYDTTHDPRQEPGWTAAAQACQQLAPQGK